MTIMLGHLPEVLTLRLPNGARIQVEWSGEPEHGEPSLVVTPEESCICEPHQPLKHTFDPEVLEWD